jgi:hypothetical protein
LSLGEQIAEVGNSGWKIGSDHRYIMSAKSVSEV